MNFADLIISFQGFLAEEKFELDSFVSEATIQHELAYFLRNHFGRLYKLSLEVNIAKFGMSKKSSYKKEIDIVINSNSKKHFIELKYLRDAPSMDLGMFSICEDIYFAGQLLDAGFDSGCVFVVTTLRNLYTPQTFLRRFRYECNRILHEQFQIHQEVSGEITLKSGSSDRRLQLNGCHSMIWNDFLENAKYSVITLDKQNNLQP